MTMFLREPSITLEDGKVVQQGDFIKIRGEYGLTFKFLSATTNVDTGDTWIDCYEMFRGRAGVLRSFKSDKIKRIPKKRVKKNVN
jgi:hypothetical protein